MNVVAQAGAVETDLATFEDALSNIIPAQNARSIAATVGLTDDSEFCSIVDTSMRSTLVGDDATRKSTYEVSISWNSSIVTDMFG